jgi:hypothetical protein
MVKLHFESLAPGMQARLEAPRRARQRRPAVHARTVVRKTRHGSVNCILADAVKMPFNRTQP